MDGEVEWDPGKRERCLAERGLDFLDAIQVLNSANLELDADSSKEKRIRTVGVVEGRVITVVWTPRKNVRRIITAWPSSRRERRLYREYIEENKDRPSLP